jgi:hypothetical protein
MFGINKLQLYGLIAATFVLGLLGIYSAGVSRGQDKIKRKLDQKLIDSMRTAKDIDDDIDTLTDTSLADRANEWVRKDNG